MILPTTPDIDARLSTWSKATKQSPELFILKTLDEVLDDWEDYTDALRICADVDSGRMNVYSLDEVARHLETLEN